MITRVFTAEYMTIEIFDYYCELNNVDNINRPPNWVMNAMLSPNSNLLFVFNMNGGYYYVNGYVRISNKYFATGYYRIDNDDDGNMILVKLVNSEDDVYKHRLLENRHMKYIPNTSTYYDILETLKTVKVIVMDNSNERYHYNESFIYMFNDMLERNGYLLEDGNRVFRNKDERVGVYKTDDYIILIYGTPDDGHYNYIDSGRNIILYKRDKVTFILDRSKDKTLFNIDDFANTYANEIIKMYPTFDLDHLTKSIRMSFNNLCLLDTIYKKLKHIDVSKSDLYKDNNCSFINKIYLMDTDDIKKLMSNYIEDLINLHVSSIQQTQHIKNLVDLSNENKMIYINRDVYLENNTYNFPECELKMYSYGSPLMYSDVLDIENSLAMYMSTNFRLTDLMNCVIKNVKDGSINNLSIDVDNRVTKSKYNIIIEMKNNRIYLNNNRINISEVDKVLERIPCIQSTEEFNSFTKDVSKLSLAMHDIIVNGIMYPSLNIIFRVKKEKNKWLIKASEDEWIVLPTGIRKLTSFNDKYHNLPFIGNMIFLPTIDIDNRKTMVEMTIRGSKTLHDMYGFDINTSIKIFKHAMEEHKFVDERAKKLLEETIINLSDKIIMNDKDKVVIKGMSGKHYLVEKDSLKVYNCNESGKTDGYICIADGKSDAVHLDRFVTRLYVLANDTLMNSEVSTLRA